VSAAEAPDEPAATSAGLRLRATWRTQAERWSHVSAHLPLGGSGRLGAALGAGQRATRYLLRWYINPIVEQQNHANAAFLSLDALTHAHALELAREVAELRARVGELELRLASGDPGPS